MRLDVWTKGSDASDALTVHTRQRLRSALDHLSHRIEKAVVRFSDVNGPRGGVDKICRVHVDLERAGSLVLTERCSDYYSAVNRAARRLKKAVSRRVDRHRAGSGARPSTCSPGFKPPSTRTRPGRGRCRRATR